MLCAYWSAYVLVMSVYWRLHFPLFDIHVIVCSNVFFVTKIPEKLNQVDMTATFKSHQLFHMLVVVKTTLVYYCIPIDESIKELLVSGMIAFYLV